MVRRALKMMMIDVSSCGGEVNVDVQVVALLFGSGAAGKAAWLAPQPHFCTCCD
jgi:hypothetical protein